MQQLIPSRYSMILTFFSDIFGMQRCYWIYGEDSIYSIWFYLYSVYLILRNSLRVPWPDCLHSFLTMPPLPPNFWTTFNFCESVSTCKKSVIPTVHSSVQTISGTHHQTHHTSFWLYVQMIICTPNVQEPFNLHEFVPACKKLVNSIFWYSQF